MSNLVLHGTAANPIAMLALVALASVAMLPMVLRGGKQTMRVPARIRRDENRHHGRIGRAD